MSHDNRMPSAGCCCGACADECNSLSGCNSRGMLMISTQDGQELRCAIIRIFEVSGQSYIALLPVHTDEMLVFRYMKDESGAVHLDNIQSEEEFDIVSETFKNFY